MKQLKPPHTHELVHYSQLPSGGEETRGGDGGGYRTSEKDNVIYREKIIKITTIIILHILWTQTNKLMEQSCPNVSKQLSLSKFKSGNETMYSFKACFIWVEEARISICHIDTDEIIIVDDVVT